MKNLKPLVSIGVPLLNEEKFLAKTLDSLLAQDYENFEIVISDNGSADRTKEICSGYAARNPRIHYHRFEGTVDVSENCARVFQLAQGEFFMWASGHDLYAPNYVSACMNELIHDPSVVLCYSEIVLIDAEGKKRFALPAPPSTQGISGPTLRYLLAFWHLGGYQICGLMKTSAMRKTNLLTRNSIAGDLIMIQELALLGTFACIHAPLHYLRANRAAEANFDVCLTRYAKTMLLKKKGVRWWFPQWRYLYEQLRALARAKIGFRRKLILYPALVAAFAAKHYSLLVRDLIRPFTNFARRTAANL